METTILIVDDHDVFRMGLKLLLAEEEEMQIVGEAGDGQAAINQVRNLEPDVVVMDISMPDMDGIEATRQILFEFPETKIIALSIHGGKDYVEEMLRVGAAGYVLKESTVEDLVHSIRAVQRGELFLSDAVEDVVISQYVESLAHSASTSDGSSHSPLLMTKLHPPRLTRNAIVRNRLLEQLHEGRERPLTLVSAPAGYGKSTLVGQWLETCDRPSAWLSLDDRDNNLYVFLTYVVAAVRTQFPEALLETATLIEASNLPPVHVLAQTLVNDLAHLPERLILVLDDYHRIEETAIHEFLGELLRHPPQTLHLVLVSRIDPALDLLQLRAHRQMAEVRAKALSFTVEETAAFLEGIVGSTVETRIAEEVMRKTEGWVTGLLLITLSLHDSAGLADFSTVLPGERQTLDYLASEALSRQPRDIQAWLLKTSILDRFCASLCEAVYAPPGDGEASRLDGDEFLRWLSESNLFVIPLDNQGQWTRYHHLFQELLQNQLEGALDDAEIADLHGRASRWFVQNGLIEEAIEHALQAGDAQSAADIVEKIRHSEHEAANWQGIERWLALLPLEIKQERPGLTLEEAWMAFNHFQMALIPPLIERAEALLSNQPANPNLWAELNFFHGNHLYWIGEPEASARYLEEALSQIAGKEKHVEGNVEVMLGLARHMTGREQLAIEVLTKRIGATDPSSEVYLRSYLFSALLFLHLLSGELDQILAKSQQLQIENKKLKNRNNDAWAFYMQGCAHLHAYHLQEAAHAFAAAAQYRYTLDTAALIDAMAGLALAQQLMGEAEKASKTIERLLELAEEINEPSFLSVARACQARIALLQGKMMAARQWARADHPLPMATELFLWLEVPALTQARVFVEDGSEKSLQEADRLLSQIRERTESHNFHNHTIEVAVLQCLILEKQGRSDKAMGALDEALALALPGGWVRPFVELGSPMFDLLKQMKGQGVSGEQGRHIDHILAAFPVFAPSRQSDRQDDLTDRELQVLRLLATKLSPQEIAEELVVSVNTVRMHTKNVYSKLDAHSRIEAVQIGRELELI